MTICDSGGIFCDLYTIPHYFLLFPSVFIVFCVMSCLSCYVMTYIKTVKVLLESIKFEYWWWIFVIPISTSGSEDAA